MTDRRVNAFVPTSVRRDHNATSSSLIAAAIRAGNVNTGDTGEKEILVLSESSLAAQEKHAQLLRRMEAEKRARQISVPTSVDEVIMRLRQLSQPITLFGEGPADRRERLRGFLARMELAAEEGGIVDQLLGHLQHQEQRQKEDDNERTTTDKDKPLEDQQFFIPIQNNALKSARSRIFTYSMQKTQERIDQERYAERYHGPSDILQADRVAAQLYQTMAKLANAASQNGDVRPLSCVRYSPDGKSIATGAWSGLVKLWDASNASERQVFRGHEDRITGLAWFPQPPASTPTEDRGDTTTSATVSLCTGSADSTAKLWNISQSVPVATLTGHRARLGNVAFHPSGAYVGTTSFDHTWRLWDVKTSQELLLQEGHYKEVYAIAFQGDGALVATGDLQGLGRLWDLRSGKSIWVMQGHSKQILSMDFNRNGIELASGSDDRTARIWDLRQRKCHYTIPAHNSMVSEVAYSPQTAELLLTASYDGTIKVWRTRDWALVSTLQGHDGKVMSADFSPDEKAIVSCGFDRTFKLWAHENEF